MRNNEKKVYFKTSDGLRLCGILSRPQNPTNKCIVLCHGIGNVDKEEDGIFTQLAKRLVYAGFAVFRFDFRGQGESEGEQFNMTIKGESDDLESAVRFLQEKEFKEFGILGASFAGGAVALFTGRNQNLAKALILWNALIDYQSLINPVTDWQKKSWGEKAFGMANKLGYAEIGSSKYKAGIVLMNEIKTLRPWDVLRETKIPMLFIHGDKDTYVPVADSIKYSSMLENAKLEIISGAEHGFHDNPKYTEQANKAAIDFFSQNM